MRHDQDRYPEQGSETGEAPSYFRGRHEAEGQPPQDSPMAIAGAVFPLSSPMVMVARAAERPELWPHVVAIVWQALWIGIVVYVSARLFRRTVLKSGPVKRRWWKKASA